MLDDELPLPLIAIAHGIRLFGIVLEVGEGRMMKNSALVRVKE